MGLLDGDIADAIASGFDGLLLAGKLRKTTVTGRDQYGDPITATVDYQVQGLQETYSAIMILAGGIPATDVKLLLIAGLCGAAPAIADKVQMGGQWFQIRNVAIDPAAATYECQSFRVPS